MKAPIFLRVVLTSLGFLTLSDSSRALSILIDFGSAATTTNHTALGGTDPLNYWNNVTSTGPLAVPLALVDTTNAFTGITFQITSIFGGVNSNGTTSASAPYQPNATGDSFYGNTELFTNGLENLTPTFTLSGLDPQSTYTFRFFASRTGVSDIRTTDYFVTGGTSGVTTLNATNNISNTASVAGISPDASGQVQISLAESATNTNSNSFVYLGTLEIVVVPEPASSGLLLMGIVAVLGRRRQRVA